MHLLWTFPCCHQQKQLWYGKSSRWSVDKSKSLKRKFYFLLEGEGGAVRVGRWMVARIRNRLEDYQGASTTTTKHHHYQLAPSITTKHPQHQAPAPPTPACSKHQAQARGGQFNHYWCTRHFSARKPKTDKFQQEECGLTIHKHFKSMFIKLRNAGKQVHR